MTNVWKKWVTNTIKSAVASYHRHLIYEIIAERDQYEHNW